MISENLSLDMLFDCTREHNLLEVTAFEHKTLGIVLVGDSHHILLDNRSSIQFGSHLVTCGTDDLHSALPCLMIGLCTDEGRQE